MQNTAISASQSFISALRLVLDEGGLRKQSAASSGEEGEAKVTRCTNLSLPFGAGGGWSKGHSIATVSIAVTISVRGMSRYLRIRLG